MRPVRLCRVQTANWHSAATRLFNADSAYLCGDRPLQEAARSNLFRPRIPTSNSTPKLLKEFLKNLRRTPEFDLLNVPG